MSPSIHAIIPVRSGSERVKDKNLRAFAGSSLLEVKIRQLISVPEIAMVHVSSESRQMLDFAERLGAVPHERDPYFSTSHVPMSEVYAYMAGQIDSEHVLLTHVTNPLAGPSVYSRMAKEYEALDSTNDSLTTVSDVKDFLYRDGVPLNFDPSRKPRSQDLPEIVKLTHVVSIAPRQMVVDTKEWFGPRVRLIKLDAIESFDIDTWLDFEIAEWLYSRSTPV